LIGAAKGEGSSLSTSRLLRGDHIEKKRGKGREGKKKKVSTAFPRLPGGETVGKKVEHLIFRLLSKEGKEEGRGGMSYKVSRQGRGGGLPGRMIFTFGHPEEGKRGEKGGKKGECARGGEKKQNNACAASLP